MGLAKTTELLVSSVIACLQLKTYNLLKSKIARPDSKTAENVVFTKTNDFWTKIAFFRFKNWQLTAIGQIATLEKDSSPFMNTHEQSSRVYLSKKLF